MEATAEQSAAPEKQRTASDSIDDSDDEEASMKVSTLPRIQSVGRNA